mgnify:CR=1 FL=1
MNEAENNSHASEEKLPFTEIKNSTKNNSNKICDKSENRNEKKRQNPKLRNQKENNKMPRKPRGKYKKYR